MNVKGSRVLRIEMDASELSIMLDGLLAIAQREVGGHPEGDVQAARQMHDQIKDAWREV